MIKIITVLILLFDAVTGYAQINDSETIKQTFPTSSNYNFIMTRFIRSYFETYDYKNEADYKSGNQHTKKRIDFLSDEYNRCHCILTVLANYADGKNLSLETILKKTNEAILHIYKTWHGGGTYIYGPDYNPLSNITLKDIKYLKVFAASPKKTLEELRR